MLILSCNLDSLLFLSKNDIMFIECSNRVKQRWGNLQYDALLLVFWSGAVIAVPYRGSRYRDVDGLFLVLTFPADDMNAFLAAVSES